MRGEHLPLGILPFETAGSSPHARGAPLCLLATAASVGIIPACAGSTVGARVAHEPR